MLEEVLASIHNWFEKETLVGELAIVDGELTLPHQFLRDGQYYRIIGSVFNDGLHQWPSDDLKDEVFYGQVWSLAVPKALQDLAAEIQEWCTKYGSTPSPYTSESFGGYSYTLGTASDGAAVTWQDIFRKRLNRWRKLP